MTSPSYGISTEGASKTVVLSRGGAPVARFYAGRAHQPLLDEIEVRLNAPRALSHACARLELQRRLVEFGRAHLGWTEAQLDDDAFYEAIESMAGLALTYAAELFHVEAA